MVTNARAAPTFQWFVNNTAVASGPTFTSSTLVTGDQVRVEVTPTAGLCSTGPAIGHGYRHAHAQLRSPPWPLRCSRAGRYAWARRSRSASPA
ncbi:MAG: hypothetical protein WKG07_02565 [Hymenobacter sp.]